MRNIRVLFTAVLLLAATGVASAQQMSSAAKPTNPPAAPILAPIAFPSPGGIYQINFGYRGSWSDGDEARWQRYRDLRDGILLSGSFNDQGANSGLQFHAANIGYRDQQYAAEYNQYGKLKVTALWSSIPLNYAYNTLTPWKDAGNNVWTLDPTTRTNVQNKTAYGIGTTSADFSKASVYRDLATPFSLQSRRDVLSVGMKYRITDAIGLNLGFRSNARNGTMPFGGSFAFSDATERPVTLDDRNNDFNAALEFAKPSTGMLRFEWNGSWFKNQFLSLTWDNPLRATDYSNGKTPPNGPYDASGYSNGNGAATGRLALPPSNNMNVFSVVGLKKLPARSTINGQFSYTMMNQNEQLIPWTSNSVIMTPAVLAAFPGLASLPRSTAEAEVRGINALVNFTSRPNDKVAFDARYRFNDRENRTPVFDAEEYVRFDAVPEELGGETEHFNIRRNTGEAGATFTVLPHSSIRIGYIIDDVKREERAFGNLTDHTFRVSFDTYGNQYIMLRGIFENTNRKGKAFNQDAITDGGAQAALRFYDDAEMGTNKGTVILQLTPTDKFDVGLTFVAGKDDYNGAGQQFGLLDNSNRSYNATLSFYPIKSVTVSGNYGYEKFSALQKSRNANPLTATGFQSWTDPGRDWNLDNDETVKNYGLSVDLLKAVKNTDLRLAYDRSQSDNAFVYSGPRILALQTNQPATVGDGSPCGATVTTCFKPLPNVTNKWQQFHVDLQHVIGNKYGLGLGYSYEKLDIVDFATTNLANGTPRIDPLGGITTGYGNRPYKGQTLSVRFIYKFQRAPVL